VSSTPYFKFWVGDYLQDTMGLSCCEHGVYLLLLAASWKRGPLPDDMDHCARLAANPPIEALRFILEEYWTLTERGWINERLERERAALGDLSEVRRLAGIKGAKARWGAGENPNRLRMVDGKRMANAWQGQWQNDSSHSHSHSHSQKEIDHASHDCPQSAAEAGSDGPERCPHKRIVELYHEALPSLPRVRTWEGNRQRMLAARWKEDPERQNLDWWKGFFEFIAESPFLTGKVQPRSGHPFVADLEWIVRPSNFQKINDGKYHR